ncbi:MAG: semialdehyde dehydrogenase [Spirochaetaceae bacterium]|nr:MAG: semialdehyde dehydrogenase [Spirochaetaceae bacterium]
MTRIALFGAGGKMGLRCARNLVASDFDVDYVEIAPEGIARLREIGVEPTDGGVAARRADAAILAVPDSAMGAVASLVVPLLPSGSFVMILDPAGPHGGTIPDRSDVGVFVSHPCHPPVVNDETDPDAKRDFYGGIKAKQSIVCALFRGDESVYTRGEAVARAIFAPVMRSHRITVEQMAILEPAMAETVTLTLMYTIREAMDEAIRAGVPEDAARDFMLGHINVNIGILFGYLGIEVSDGAKRAVERGRAMILKENWRDVFRPQNVMAEVRAIVDPR